MSDEEKNVERLTECGAVAHGLDQARQAVLLWERVVAGRNAEVTGR